MLPGLMMTPAGGTVQAGVSFAEPPDPLYILVQDSAGKSAVVTHPDLLATTATTSQEGRIPLSQLTAAGVKTANVQELTIGVGNRDSLQADGAGLLYIDDIGFGHPAQ